jgi:hypothetical protein
MPLGNAGVAPALSAASFCPVQVTEALVTEALGFGKAGQRDDPRARRPAATSLTSSGGGVPARRLLRLRMEFLHPYFQLASTGLCLMQSGVAGVRL